MFVFLRQGSAPNIGQPGVGQRRGHIRQRLQCERKALFFHRDIKKERWSSPELLKPSGKTFWENTWRSPREISAGEKGTGTKCTRRGRFQSR